MPFVIAALVGAGLGLAAYLITARVTGAPITWKRSLAAALGGALGGIVLTATLGAGGAAAATSLRITGATLASGAASGGSEQLARNELEGRPAGERVLSSAAVAAGAAITFRAAGPLLFRSVRPPAPVSLEENAGIISALSRLGPTGAAEDLTRRTGRKLAEKLVKDHWDINDPSPSQTAPPQTDSATGDNDR